MTIARCSAVIGTCRPQSISGCARAGVLKGESKFYLSIAHDAEDVRHTLAAFAAAVQAEDQGSSRAGGCVGGLEKC